MDLSPDGQLIAAAGLGTMMIVWEVESGNELLRAEEASKIDAVAFSPDEPSRQLAYATDTAVTLMHVDTRQKTTVQAPHSIIWSLEFSRDGSMLYCGCQGHVEVFEVPSMRLLDTLPGSRGPIPNIAISPDDMTLVVPNWGGFA